MPASLTVTWQPSTRAHDITYKLQYRLKGSTVWIDAAVQPLTKTTMTVTGLTPGSVYQFRHIATNGPIWTEISMPSELRAGTPPGQPTSMKVTQ